MVSDFQDWGYNTAGYHSPLSLLEHLPFLQDCYPAQISYWMGKPAYPDVFDPAFQTRVENLLEAACAPVRGHRNLIGVYWTDTPQWDLNKARARWDIDWVSAIRSLPSSAPGKRSYVEYLLRTIHGDDDLKLYLGNKAKPEDAFHRLMETAFEDLDREHPVVLRDDKGFLRLIARKYYQITAQATHHAARGHLLFGDRYIAGDHPDEVLEEAVPHIDVVSIQPYGNVFDREYFEPIHAKTGKPILICDHAINFPVSGYSGTVWPQCASEEEAALSSTKYLRDLFGCSYMIGYHRCQYIDRVVPGTSLLKQGLLQSDETPYTLLIEHLRQANQEILDAFKLSAR